MTDFIKSIDPTFEANPNIPYQFINKNQILLEIINPLSRHITTAHTRNIDQGFTDIIPLEMQGMEWLESSRLLHATVIGLSGRPARITTLHPLDFCIYKNWLGGKTDRDPIKTQRDTEQSRLITTLIIQNLPQIDIQSELENIRHFKRESISRFYSTIYEAIQNQTVV